MIYFRWTYDFEYGDHANEHPIIEVVRDKTTAPDLSNIISELRDLFQPGVLQGAEIRIKRK